MTASEPTAMTLEQGIAEIGELGLVILRDSGPGDTWNIYDPHSDDRWFGQTLAGTIEAVLPDVAIRRDEAAELRAAIREWVEAHGEVVGSTYSAPPKGRYYRLLKAQDTLRRLAGMEDEK